jgi:hydroxyacylglutathione hydrolase
MQSTVGWERRRNPYLAIEDYEAFCEALRRDAPPTPTHYPRLKHVNAAGPPVLRCGPRPRPMRPAAFAEALEMGAQTLDTREPLGFGGGHPPGAINIAARPELSVWAGWLLDPERPLHLIVEDESTLDAVCALLWRTGFTDIAGYLAGGVSAWVESGRPLRRIPQITARELAESTDATPLDVRKPDEWAGGHAPGALHCFLGEMPRRLDELRGVGPFATYCATGYRASIAASLLARAGHDDVACVPGSWSAWTAGGLDVEKPEGDHR